jgi:hypothetical protein
MSANRAAPLGTSRFLLAWIIMVAGPVGFWYSRPWMNPVSFDAGQIAVLILAWKIASLICLPRADWARFTPWRFLAYCFWIGMQPRMFLVGYQPSADALRPTVPGILVNGVAGAGLLWLVPRFLPPGTPVTIRVWIALIGFGWFTLFARLDLVTLIFRLGFPVEKLFVCPFAATTLGEFWGQRWNRVVSGMLRDTIFLPLSRRAGTHTALFAVFLYSGMYHEFTSFMAGSGYGKPLAYFLIQFAGVSLETIRPIRLRFRRHLWLGRLWTIAIVVLPCPLFLHQAFLDTVMVPLFTTMGVPGLMEP